MRGIRRENSESRSLLIGGWAAQKVCVGLNCLRLDVQGCGVGAGVLRGAETSSRVGLACAGDPLPARRSFSPTVRLTPWGRQAHGPNSPKGAGGGRAGA